MSGQTPHDLALYVYGRLASLSDRPDVATLDQLFATLYLTSLRREEGADLTCSISYVNPKNPDPDPPTKVRDPRWTVSFFSAPFDFSVSHLAKLALAADPSSTCLAVYPNQKGRLKIWGLIDQQGGFQSMLSYEGKGGWVPPGLFHAQIVAAGQIIVMRDIAVVAELNGDTLVEDSVEVFQNSGIREKLEKGFARRIIGIER